MDTPFNEKRFLTITKFMSVLSKILMILMMVGFGILVIAFIVILFIPRETLTFDLSRFDQLTFTVLNIDLHLPAEFFEGTYTVKGLMLLTIVTGQVAISFFFYFLRLLHKVLKDVSLKMPFSSANVKRLFHMSYAFIIMAFILPIFMFITSWQLIHTLDIDASVSYSVDANTLFIGILLWILASIFNYGKYLQDEVDQTV